MFGACIVYAGRIAGIDTGGAARTARTSLVCLRNSREIGVEAQEQRAHRWIQ